MEAGFLQGIYGITEEFVRIFLPASPHVFRNYCASITLKRKSGEVEDRHIRCNFVVIRYGGADFVRVSTIVCLSAHIIQKLFLTRPNNKT